MYALKRFVVFCLAIIFILSGLIMGNEMLDTYNESKDWTETKAKVTTFNYARDQSSFLAVRYALKFVYHVDGKRFTGTTYSQDDLNGTMPKNVAESVKKELAIGSVVPAFYNPQSPGQSYLKQMTLADAIAPGIMIGLLGLWFIYLLRKTRVRRVPQRVLRNPPDMDSEYWYKLYDRVLQKDYVQVPGSGWYPRSRGVTEWPKSRVGLVATPNSVAVVRGTFTMGGILAAGMTILMETAIGLLLTIIHGFAFVAEWIRRKATWRHFRLKNNPDQYSTGFASAVVVPIDAIQIVGFDARKKELWYMLPHRGFHECIKIKSSDREELEEFIAFVLLMQRSQAVLNDGESEVKLDLESGPEVSKDNAAQEIAPLDPPTRRTISDLDSRVDF